LIWCLGIVLLHREKEEAGQNRTKECECVRQSTANLLAHHGAPENDPTLDKSEDEEETEPGEENG
jgi:hypothetical protein